MTTVSQNIFLIGKTKPENNSPKGQNVMRIGVESFGSFGDNCFNTAIIKALSEKFDTKISVASHKNHSDAFLNLPFIDDLKFISFRQEGESIFKNYDCNINITPYLYYNDRYLRSLVSTQEMFAKMLDLDIECYKPVFIPTTHEIDNEHYDVAIESEYNSYQSWASIEDIRAIASTFRSNKILWCSKSAPLSNNMIVKPSRRSTIAALRNVKHFFSVGSGIFCGSLSGYHPENIYVLWRDEYYKYKATFKERGWDHNITWVENRDQLFDILNRFRIEGVFNHGHRSV